MNVNSQISILILLLSSILSSCKNTDEYSIDEEFSIYLKRFENEAAAHGRHFDFKNSGLILEFADLQGTDAGLCHPNERPIRIEFDRGYWNAISEKSGADLMKENLMFHELGHGPLKREHLNTLLPNGEWKSMMCGGSRIDDRAWNINYRGERHSYYIDELFNESTLPNSISYIESNLDTTIYNTTLLSISFDNPANAGWALVDTTTYHTYLENGKLCFQPNKQQPFFVSINLDSRGINTQSDFSYELTFSYPSNRGNEQYGIIFGAMPSSSHPSITESIDYFSINNTQNMFIGNSQWYSFYLQLPISQYYENETNKLKVFKNGSMLYFYINSHFCYQSEISISSQGTHFGFLAPPSDVLFIDNLVIKSKSAANSSQKVSKSKNAPLELTVTEYKLTY